MCNRLEKYEPLQVVIEKLLDAAHNLLGSIADDCVYVTDYFSIWQQIRQHQCLFLRNRPMLLTLFSQTLDPVGNTVAITCWQQCVPCLTLSERD